MLKYIIIVILLIIIMFGLVWLSEKLMARHGTVLTEKYREKFTKKRDLKNLNNTCLIIAFLFFVITFLPELNKGLFLTMAFIFALRSLNGYMSIFRAAWLIIGSFSLGIILSMADTGTLDDTSILVLAVIAVPMLLLGFKETKKKKVKKKELTDD